MEQVGFELPKMVWQIINLLIILGLMAIPVWIIVKLKSIDKRLKNVESKQNKNE